MAVPERVAMRHHEQSIAQRRVARLASSPCFIPELERTAPLRIPFARKVVEDRDLALEMTKAIAIEVRVEREVPAGQRQRHPSTTKVGVRDQSLDAGQVRQEIEEGHARQLGEE